MNGDTVMFEEGRRRFERCGTEGMKKGIDSDRQGSCTDQAQAAVSRSRATAGSLDLFVSGKTNRGGKAVGGFDTDTKRRY